MIYIGFDDNRAENCLAKIAAFSELLFLVERVHICYLIS